jgi:internalin A
MRKQFLHIVFTLLLVLSSNLSMAWTGVYIPDANFRNFLNTSYPATLYADKSLNTAAAAAVTASFKCYSQNISDLTGIEYFTNILTLEVKYNPNLHTIPNIDGLTSITTLGLDSNDLTSLPNLSALTNLQVLSFHHNRISVLPSVSNLSQLRILFVHNNQLTTLPDLSALVNLDKLFIAYNPISSLPSFSPLVKLTYLWADHILVASLPSLNSCVLLQHLISSNSQFSTLPDITNCAQLQEIWMPGCQLTTLPNLSGYTSLNTLEVSNSALSFEDILPSIGNPNFNLVNFDFTGQQPGTAATMSVLSMSAVDINLGYDNAVTSNVYKWYKDGSYISTTTVNHLSFASISLNDEGVYTCIITNTTPSLNGLSISSKPITLKVSPCILSNNLHYTVDNTTCTYPITVVLDESSFTAGTSPFSYKVANTKDTLLFTTSTFSLKKEGVFDLIVTDATGCEATFESELKIGRNQQCDAVFYPNGDGVADTYYIENTGQAQIYDRTGQLVKELTVPANWDGTDKRGQNAPTGLYVIVVNKDTTIQVTLLR